MADIVLVDLGNVPNDGEGDPLRNGGNTININFDELNIKKLETGGYVGTAQDLNGRITSIEFDHVTLFTDQEITGLKTFNPLPQSTQVPQNASDLVNKDYVDNAIAGGSKWVDVEHGIKYDSGNVGIGTDADELAGLHLKAVDTNIIQVLESTNDFCGIQFKVLGNPNKGIFFFQASTDLFYTNEDFRARKLITKNGTIDQLVTGDGTLIDIESISIKPKLVSDIIAFPTYDIDWSFDTWDLFINSATEFTESNLPLSGTNTKVITLYVQGEFPLTFPEGWSDNIIGEYDGAVRNQIVVEFIKDGDYAVEINQPDNE